MQTPPNPSGITAALRRGRDFLRRQDRDWRITVIRTSLDKLAYQMVFPYLSIYIVALGASGTDLGLVNSIGMVSAGLIAPFTGWLIDRIGPKRIYLIGIALLALSYLVYALAGHWGVTVLAMLAYWLGFSVSTQSCATICGNCLVNRDRATGMLICETVAAGLLGMAGPLLATWLVSLAGGVNVAGIRPLFVSGLIVSAGSFLLVLTQLSERRWLVKGGAHADLWRGLSEVLASGPHLKRWLLIAAVTQLPLGMVFPFAQVFAHTVKGADGLVLGTMVTGSALTSILLAIPLGRWADRVGRKRVLFVVMPLFWLSNLLLVWAPAPWLLVVAGLLQGFFFIGVTLCAAIERELVGPAHMGRWIGINRLCKMLLSAAMAFLAGILWDRLGPPYLFLIFVALDVLIRLPLLIGMPETLHRRTPPPEEPARG